MSVTIAITHTAIPPPPLPLTSAHAQWNRCADGLNNSSERKGMFNTSNSFVSSFVDDHSHGYQLSIIVILQILIRFAPETNGNLSTARLCQEKRISITANHVPFLAYEINRVLKYPMLWCTHAHTNDMSFLFCRLYLKVYTRRVKIDTGVFCTWIRRLP
jgi:N-acetylglucosamine-6-phosphate deacetylase